MKCVWMISYPCKISVETQYHVTEGGIEVCAEQTCTSHYDLQDCSAQHPHTSCPRGGILESVCPCTLFLLSREKSERGRYHEIEGGSDGAARSKLAHLAALYKIAARSILIRAVPRSGASSLSPRCRFHESIWTLHKSRLSHAQHFQFT